MTHKEIIIDILKVFGIHACAITITFSDVADTLKIISLLLAISYGAWKWRVDYVKNKNEK